MVKNYSTSTEESHNDTHTHTQIQKHRDTQTHRQIQRERDTQKTQREKQIKFYDTKNMSLLYFVCLSGQ